MADDTEHLRSWSTRVIAKDLLYVLVRKRKKKIEDGFSAERLGGAKWLRFKTTRLKEANDRSADMLVKEKEGKKKPGVESSRRIFARLYEIYVVCQLEVTVFVLLSSRTYKYWLIYSF